MSLRYPLLGPRPYAHGSSMIDGMLQAMRGLEPELEAKGAIIRQFKVIRQFSTFSIAEAMPTPQALNHPRLSEAAARLDVIVEGRKLTSLLFPTDETVPDRLPAYDPAGYLKTVDYDSASATFAGLSDFVELIRGLNECNRLLTVSSFPQADWSKRVRWAYVQNLPLLSTEACRSLRSVRFSAPETVDLGRRQRFEIKQGTLVADDATYPFAICFFIELPEEPAS